MSETPTVEELSAVRPLVLILRVMLSANGRLIGGELVEADGALWCRFSGRAGLIDGLDSWLQAQMR